MYCRRSTAKNKIYWRCEQYKDILNPCKGTIITTDKNEFCKFGKTHSHPPNAENKLIAKSIANRLKEISKTNNSAKPYQIVQQVRLEFQEIDMFLGTDQSMKQIVKKIRK